MRAYFSVPAAVAGEDSERAQQRRAVEDALSRGAVGSLLLVTDPETNRLQGLAVEGNRHGIPVLFMRGST